MASATKVNMVEMKDGRSVDFGQRGKLKKNTVINGEGTERNVTISVDCLNGDTHSVTFDINHPLLFEMAAHGFSQKISDSITKAETPDDVAFGVENQITQIANGVWVQRAAEGMVRGFSDLLEAIRRLKKYEVGSEEAATLKTTLAAASEEQFKLYKGNNAVKAVLAEIAAEKATARAAKLSQDSTEDLEGLGI